MKIPLAAANHSNDFVIGETLALFGSDVKMSATFSFRKSGMTNSAWPTHSISSLVVYGSKSKAGSVSANISTTKNRNYDLAHSFIKFELVCTLDTVHI